MPWRTRLGAAVLLAVALVAVLGAAGSSPASAHAGLRSSDPPDGAVFDVPPTAVRLTFLELPEPSLAVIGVRGADGTSYASGPPAAMPGDELTLVVPVQLVERQAYTVTWRVVSAVDGHSSAGTFSFGVGVPPAELVVSGTTAGPSTLSPLELLGRWAFALGLIVVLGAATAGLFGFGGSAALPGSVRMGAVGLASAILGLVVLGVAQRRAAAVPLADLMGTSIGRALVWRAGALAVVAAGLLLSRTGRSGAARPAAWVMVAAASVAVAAHVAAGHAGASGGRASFLSPSVAVQWAHVVAVCVWAGGLAALLVGLRGAPSNEKAVSVRRFSAVAAPTLAVIIATGVLRAFDGVPTWAALGSTAYGRSVVTKLVLVSAIVGLASANRRRGVSAAATNLHLLRRLAGGELALAIGAVGAAALLASLPPPASARGAEPRGLTATGSDLATTVRVRLTTETAVPGPNRFAVRVSDYDSGEAVVADRVSLRFRPLDDPAIASTLLVLEPAGPQSYEAAGTNLSFDGRWGITVLVERGPESVAVPLEVQTRSAPQFLSVERVPGEPVKYTVELVSGGAFLRVWADPQRSGPTQVYATFFDRFGEELPVGEPVLTTGSGPPARQHAMRRLAPNRFVADVSLDRGQTVVAVVARTVVDDQRLRGTVTLETADR